MPARVLVVEDEPAIREPVARALRSAGFAVRAVADGTDFEAVVDAFRPDLAVLDLMLSAGTGTHWRRWCRAVPTRGC